MASAKQHKTAGMLATPPPRLYTREEDQQILQGIVVLKKSCKELGELLGRDRRSVNKRFKILISRGTKQKPATTQGEPAAAALAVSEKKQKPSKKVVMLACKPHRVVGFTAKGKPILDSVPASLAAPSSARQLQTKPASASTSVAKHMQSKPPSAFKSVAKQLQSMPAASVAAHIVEQPLEQQHRRFTPSEDRHITESIRAGIPASVVAAQQQRTEKDIQQRFVRVEAHEREMRVNASRLKINM